MKRHVFLPLILVLSLFSGASGVTPEELSDQIEMAIDYSKTGLTEEAKRILIPLLYEPEAQASIPELRYLLGAICFFDEQDGDCGLYHWNILIADHPNAEEAEAVKAILHTRSFFASELMNNVQEDYVFIDELALSRRFWIYKSPDWKMKWDDIESVELALAYIDSMVIKYSSPMKKAVLWYDKFLILTGFNSNGYGYLNTKDKSSVSRLDKEKNEILIRETTDSLRNCSGCGEYYYTAPY